MLTVINNLNDIPKKIADNNYFKSNFDFLLLFNDNEFPYSKETIYYYLKQLQYEIIFLNTTSRFNKNDILTIDINGNNTYLSEITLDKYIHHGYKCIAIPFNIFLNYCILTEDRNNYKKK